MKRLQKTFVLLSLILGAFSVSAGSTSAHFSDTETSDTTTITSGTLGFSVVPSLLSTGFGNDTTPVLYFGLTDTGTMPSQYEIEIQNTACSEKFFNGLEVVASRGATEHYDGPLGGLYATSTSFGQWSLELSSSISLSAIPNEVCEVALHINAWQEGVSSFMSGGFWHSEVVTMIISAFEAVGPQPTGTVVLNEIYPNPIATTTEPLEREWIELYNGTGVDADVLGWKVNQHTIVASCTGGSNEMQPYSGGGTALDAGDLLIIEFCNNGGNNKLTNGGASVTLYDAGSVMQDSHTYPSTAAGKSHARIPDGYTWVDPVPTPGKPNTATMDDLLNEGWTMEEIEAVQEVVTDFEPLSVAPLATADPVETVVASSTATSTTEVASSTAPAVPEEPAAATLPEEPPQMPPLGGEDGDGTDQLPPASDEETVPPASEEGVGTRNLDEKKGDDPQGDGDGGDPKGEDNGDEGVEEGPSGDDASGSGDADGAGSDAKGTGDAPTGGDGGGDTTL